MKLFKHSSGIVVAFGFDMLKRRENARVICWSDPNGTEWEARSDNLAGWNEVSWPVNPEFVFEVDQRIVAYQPGRCTVLEFTGAPYVWRFTTMLSDESGQRSAA